MERGGQTTIRPATDADAALLAAWHGDPEVSRHWDDETFTVAETHERLGRPGVDAWIIEADGEPVGLANLARIDAAARRCEWAYYLGEPSTRGKGLGARIEYVVLRHVFETLGFNKLWCEVLAGNEAVWRLHQSFGFVREALFRQHVVKGGAFQDVVGLGMLKSDWDAARPAIEARLREKGHRPEDLPDAP